MQTDENDFGGTVCKMSSNSDDAKITPREYIERGLAEEDQMRQWVVVLNSKLRTYAHPLMGISPPTIIAAAHPPFAKVTELATNALAVPNIKTRKKAPRKWPQRSHYAGLILRDPFINKDPLLLEDIGILQRVGPAPEEHWFVGFGWMERVTGVREDSENRVWIEDPNRGLEISLLKLLCEDPLARQQLKDYHEHNLKLSEETINDIFGNTDNWEDFTV